MSHNVETMAYTNEVPWHGLGVRVDNKTTVNEMLKAAKLDWRVERRPMMAGSYDSKGEPNFLNGVSVEGFAALVRSSDSSVLDVVGSRYVPSQNKEVFSFFKEFVEAGKATMETAGSLQKGKIVWGLARLNSKFELRNNDVVKAYLLMINYHEQGKANIAKLVNTRVVCNNTLSLGLRENSSEFRASHRNEFDEVVIERAKETLGIARDQFGEFEKNARKLQKLKLTEKDAMAFFAGIYQPQIDLNELMADFDGLASAKLVQTIDVYHKAPGADPGNGWGALNAVTYVSDHLASRTADKRLTNAWLGKTARHKETALKTLMEMAS